MTPTPEQLARNRAEYAKLAGMPSYADLKRAVEKERKRDDRKARRNAAKARKPTPTPTPLSAGEIAAWKEEAEERAAVVAAERAATRQEPMVRVPRYLTEAARIAAKRDSRKRSAEKHPPDAIRKAKQRLTKKKWARKSRANKAAKKAQLKANQAVLFAQRLKTLSASWTKPKRRTIQRPPQGAVGFNMTTDTYGVTQRFRAEK